MAEQKPIQLHYATVKSSATKRPFAGAGFAFWLICLQIPWFVVTMMGGYMVLGDPEPTRNQLWILGAIVSMPSSLGVAWEIFFIMTFITKRVSIDSPAMLVAILGLIGCLLEVAVVGFVLHHG